MSNVYKFYRYTKKQGIGKAFRKTVLYAAKKARIAKRTIDVMVDIDDIVSADFHNHPYIRPMAIKKGHLTIAWVLSPVSPGSGGINTITRFANFLQKQGHLVTIYIYEGVHPQSASEAKKILLNHFNLDVVVREIAEYTSSDVIIATGWETAYPVFNLQTSAHKFYFVQDYEPFFYGVGSKTVLAENTNKMGFYGITAGKWLAHKLNTEYSMKTDYFDFGVDVDVYRPKDILNIQKQKKIIFYARPVTERRAFELGIISLEVFHRKHPEYIIELFGWDVGDYNIPFPYVNRGILPQGELAILYQQSVACLVLSLTNVSLLPLELLASGCIPVINEGDNNEMVLGSNDHIRYSPASPVQLADELVSAVTNTNLLVEARNASKSVHSITWESSYAKVETILKREVAKVEATT